MEKKIFLFVLAMGLALSGCIRCGPLESPIMKGDIDKVRALLESGVDVNERGSHGCTAIHRATGSEFNPQLVKFLIEEGADVNMTDKYGQTPLIWVSWMEVLAPKERVEAARLLLDSGADPDLIDDFGHTALMYATRNTDIMLVRLLIEKGADVNIKVKGNTALKEAKRWLFRGRGFCPERTRLINILKIAGAVE